MTQDKMIDAITEIDTDILDLYFAMKQNLTVKKKAKAPAWVKWCSFAAACFALLIGAILFFNHKPEMPQNIAPLTAHYASLEEAHNALGRPTLYSKITLDALNSSAISIIYDSIDGDIAIENNFENIQGGLLPNYKKPRQLCICTSYDKGKIIDMVVFYILFNQDSVDNSRIGGYVEQGLTKEIGGVTVHYSLIDDGTMHGHAKFVYNGDLYVIDVKSSGSVHTLDTYLDMVLN